MTDTFLKHRRKLLPYLAKKLKSKSYLEIGVKGGKTFLPIKVRNKYAIDPSFRIKKDYKRNQLFKYPYNVFAQYFECTSDTFFDSYASDVLKKNNLDLCFIDGLHTYQQTYKDVINALPYLSNNGVMVVHDCSPLSASAAFPAQSLSEVKRINPPGFDGMWSGDVWKLIPRLRVEFPEYTIFVINHDSGLGIITKSKIFDSIYQPTKPDFNLNDIKQWNYNYLAENRVKLLNILTNKFLIEHCSLFK